MADIIGLKSKVFLAPMAGITDYPMRQIVHSKGDGNLYSEMVAINALQYKNPKSYRIADVRAEKYPVIVQLAAMKICSARPQSLCQTLAHILWI